MFRDRQRGAILVASMIILALLSLLGAGSLLNATLDTQLAYNRSVSGEAFYSAEAGLDAGVGEVFEFVKDTLRPYDPVGRGVTNWTTPTSPAAVDFTDLNGYNVEYKINYAGTTTPGGEPKPYQFSAMQSGQALESDAYTYLIESRAVGADGTTEAMSETLQLLETPLVQYYVFFDDDLGWHPGKHMASWGRIHSNGDIGFANQDAAGVHFDNYDGENQETPSVITASGIIRYQGWLQQDGSWSSRATTPVRVRVNNLATIPTTNPTGGDYVQINATINGASHAVQEARFVDADGVFHVRTGVDPMPSVTFKDIARGGFYEVEAANPWKPNVDGMVIHADAGLAIWFKPHDGPGAWVEDLVRDFEVAPGVPVDLVDWSKDARRNASNNEAPAELPARGSIVYCPSDFVPEDDGRAIPNKYTAYSGASANPWFPAMLELEDGRDATDVSLLVIDMQRLQEWYHDYLDYRDTFGPANTLDDSVSTLDPAWSERKLLIYASLSNSATVAGSPTVTGMPAVKLIGSAAGRTRNTVDRQGASDLAGASSPTLLVPTTVVTDNPMYMDGDFNAPDHADATPDVSPGSAGCALISDALTMLSNEWGRDNFNSGAPKTGAAFVQNGTGTDTAFNAAFFTGRFDFRNIGAGGEEAGIHNFPHFIEGWGTTCHITGCLINLWFSQQSTGRHHGGYYGPPTRQFGWDRGFASRAYWPPYVPSIYSIERTAWRED